jgi:histidinol-phosphate aminotransferase
MPHSIPKKTINDLPYVPLPVMPEPDAMLVEGKRRLHLNESPIPPSQKTIVAMTKALLQVGKYPDNSCDALQTMLSERLGIAKERFFFGGGSGELLLATALISIDPGDEVILPVPTFPTFGKGVALSGGRAIGILVNELGANNVKAMVAAITPKTQVVYACSPNNPTGGLLSEEEVTYLGQNVPNDILLLIDEAYHEFGAYDGGPNCLEILSKRKGLWAITRTFSKAYSMAGMRAGYGIAGSVQLAMGFHKVRGNFTINRVAIAGAVAAYKDINHRDAYLAENATQRTRLNLGLESLGFKPFPSNANFVTTQSPIPTEDLVAHLAENHILVQALTWPGAGPCLRIGVGSDEDTTTFLNCLTAYIKKDH